MATNNPSPFLPPIPQLMGEGNLEQWKQSIMLHSRYHHIQPHFDGTVKEPAGRDAMVIFWQERVLAMDLMIKSIFYMEDYIKAAGWRDTEAKPKVLWDLILDFIPKLSTWMIPGLYYGLTSAVIKPGTSLKSFNTRFNITADRLGDFGMPLPPTVKLFQMMRAIQYQHPRVYELLGRDFDKGKLTWESFQGEVIRVADEEENDHAEAFLIVAPHIPSRRGEGPQQVRCPMCGGDFPPTWHYCTSCSKHHGRGWHGCCVFHPERRPNSPAFIAYPTWRTYIRS